jgi:uncharacterized protein
VTISGRGSRVAPDTRPLTWNVARLLSEPPGSTRDYHVAGVTIRLPDDLRLADPIEGDIRLARTNRGLLVSANLTTAIEAQCSRCLRDIVVPLDLAIEEEALPSIELDTGLPVDTDAEPDVVRLNDHHELELEPVVADAISLAEPIAPLCRPDCKGLCPVCGESLEQGVHDHPEDDVDPRLAALRGFHPADEVGEADEADARAARSAEAPASIDRTTPPTAATTETEVDGGRGTR